MKTLKLARSITVLFFIFSSVTQAQMRPQSVEIDGLELSVTESMDLLLNRGKKFVISDFKSVKINGKEVIPYVMHSGEAIFVRTLQSSGDSTSYEAKLQSPKKLAVLCNSNVAGIPNGFEVSLGVNLQSGEAIFASMLAGDPEAKPYMMNGQTKGLFVCAP